MPGEGMTNDPDAYMYREATLTTSDAISPADSTVVDQSVETVLAELDMGSLLESHQVDSHGELTGDAHHDMAVVAARHFMTRSE